MRDHKLVIDQSTPVVGRSLGTYKAKTAGQPKHSIVTFPENQKRGIMY